MPSTGVGAVALTVTAIDRGAPGYLTVLPSLAGVASGAKNVSDVNFSAGETVSSTEIVPALGFFFYPQPEGAFVEVTASVTSVNFTTDVSGWFSDIPVGTTAGQLIPVAHPTGLCARQQTPVAGGCGVEDIGPGSALTYDALQVAGAPPGATAAAVQVDSIHATKGRSVTVFPTGTGVPVASALNPVPGRRVTTTALATLGFDDQFNVCNASGTVDISLTLLGWHG